MKPKTELLLYWMLFIADKSMSPGFRNLNDGFESWAYRNGFLKQIHRLEARGFLESTLDGRTGKRLHRLTRAGLLAAHGGRDPETCWAAPWDGKWRYILFDIPEKHRSKRKNLTRALQVSGCGCLQRSVWIAPMLPAKLEKMAAKSETDCSKLLILTADSKGAATDRQMVIKAWDFRAINALYQEHMLVLDQIHALKKDPDPDAFMRWSGEEHETWKAALAADPLLPDALLPSGYLGKKALRHHRKILRQASTLAAKIHPS